MKLVVTYIWKQLVGEMIRGMFTFSVKKRFITAFVIPGRGAGGYGPGVWSQRATVLGVWS